MKIFFKNYIFFRNLASCAIVVLFFFVFNPQGLTYNYGTSGGRYADNADSFSEYIVRNTIKRNVLNSGDASRLPIITKGYKSGNYDYTQDEYVKYYSNLALQTIPATFVAKALRLDTEVKLNRYFGILRLLNAMLLSVFLVGITLTFCGVERQNLYFLIPLLIGCNAGFIFYSHNLYFASCLMVFPAFYIAMCHHFKMQIKWFLVFLFGVLYFLRGFEFTTIFAILTSFSAALLASGSISTKAKIGSKAFLIIVLSFVCALTFHVLFVSVDMSLSLNDTIQMLFKKYALRTQSTEGVPFPFSPEFVKTINERWKHPSFIIIENGISLSQWSIIITMIFAWLIRIGKATNEEILIYLYGFFGYVSCYVFTYQHIMGHPMYDWYVFALTMGLSFALLVIFYCSLLVGNFNKFCGPRFNNV